MKDKSILVVDDELEMLKMIISIFERAGYTQIISASSAKEALKILSAKMPEIIVLDVMMPEMDALNCYKKFGLSVKFLSLC